MDRLDTYRQIIRKVLKQYINIDYANADSDWVLEKGKYDLSTPRSNYQELW